MIWLALLIPVLAVVILAWKFRRAMHLVEYLIVFVVPIICIVVGKYCSVSNQVKDKEFWNSYGTKAVYEEEWRERWTEVETYMVTVGSGKNARTEMRTRVVTKRRTHPEKWYMYDNIGKSYRISRNHFEQVAKMWGNRTFKDMMRHKNGHTITKDGDAYITIYNNQFDTTVPICTEHSYKNKVQCSKSVFNYQEVSDEEIAKYALHHYPQKNLFEFNPLLGYKNGLASDNLRKYNALNGYKKQLHMMLLVFNKQPLEAGLFQESFWKGGNKNEFVLCVGIDGDDIKWTRVISWTENEELKVKTAREIKEMGKFDAVKVVDYMGQNVTKRFLRKEFADFDYISVQPTTTAVMITFIITLLVTGIISIISIRNCVSH